MGKVWIPLESNPEVITRYAAELGVSEAYGFEEILSLELLSMVPRPVYAVILLFPLTEKIVAATRGSQDPSAVPDVFFCRQTISNACGTIALLHAAANNMEALDVRSGSFLQEFVAGTVAMSPEDRAKRLEESDELDKAQDRFSQEGDTAAPRRGEDVDTHFVAFVRRGDRLIELDGRKTAPVNHGDTSADTLLEDACMVIKDKFMSMDPSEIRFTMMALGPRM